MAADQLPLAGSDEGDGKQSILAGVDTAKLIAQLYRAPVPTIKQFIEDPYYLGDQVRPCGAQIEVLEQIFDPRRVVNLAALIWGVGGGKSFIVSCALAYQVYRVLCLRDPQAYYGLASGSQITFVNFSVSATQAQAVVFQETAARIDGSPAFQQPGFQRDPRVKSHLRWPDQNVTIFPGTSQSRSAIGYNVLGAAIDEACWFHRDGSAIFEAGQKVAGESDEAEQLAVTIQQRMRSRGGNARWRRDNLLLAISSPRTTRDWAVKVVYERGGEPGVFVDQRPTWQGFPSLSLSGETFDDPILGPVPVEYKEFFDRSPERARRDLGAMPNDSIDAFFSQTEKLQACYDERLTNCFDGMRITPGWWPRNAFAPRFVHVDLGLKRDACGLAVGYYDLEWDAVVFDGVTYLKAEDFGGEVDLEYVRNLIVQLKYAGIRIQQASYDGFQSADSIQMLNRVGIAAVYLSVDRGTAAYDTCRDLAYTGRLLLPPQGRAGKWIEEARWLELIKGKKVDHPPHSSKDVTDAVAGVCIQAFEYEEMSDTFELVPRQTLGLRR